MRGVSINCRAEEERQLGAQVDRQVELARLGLSMEEFCRRVSQGLKQASWEQKRQLIEWLVARVVVTDGEVEIRYVIQPAQPAKPPTFVICVQTIERLINRLKQFRRIATRYEKRGVNYLAMVMLGMILLWL